MRSRNWILPSRSIKQNPLIFSPNIRSRSFRDSTCSQRASESNCSAPLTRKSAPKPRIVSSTRICIPRLARPCWRSRSPTPTLPFAAGLARAKALESMWRSLYKPYAKYFAPHLDDKDIRVLRQALRGAGYFRLTAYADKIAAYFEAEGDLEDLRDDALFAYALAMPGETTRGRARGMLRKVDSLSRLAPDEIQLVMFAIDERLRLHGLDPVFESESDVEEEAEPEPVVAAKPGRNDPCPCGSGKKYKKCCGA